MTEAARRTPPHPLRALRSAGLLAVQFFAGLFLVCVAGLVAVITAFAGLMLAAAAVLVRFMAPPRGGAIPAEARDGAVTLNARRTPRGWTVE
jgi:hypothetical protein